MDILPPEIWCAILGFISNQNDQYQCALINKQCYATMTPILWNSPGDDRTIPTVDRLLTCLISSELYNKANDLPHTQTPGRHVRELIYPMLKSTDPLLSLLTRTPLLTDLMIGCDYETEKEELQQYAKDILMQIPQQCPELTNLQLDGLYLTTDLIESFGQHCKQLKKLRIDECSTDSPDIFLPFSNSSLTDIVLRGQCASMTANETATHLRQITTLKSLTLICIDHDIDILRHFSTANNTGLPLLTSFYFSPKANDALILQPVLEAFIKSHPLLEHIECGANSSILATMANHLPKLRYLRVREFVPGTVTEDCIRSLAKHCPRLEYLVISNARRFPELGKGVWNAFTTSHLQLLRHNAGVDSIKG